MPRSIWNGTVTVGLMSVPIKLFTATDNKTVRFREVHLEDGAKIEHRRFCSKEDREVPYDEVVKGHEVAPDEYVVLEKDEIAAAAGDGAHRIDVEHFVPAGDIDPIFYDRTYHVGAGKDGEEVLRLLHDALDRTGRAAIGRFTFHDREYLTALRARDGLLVLHTLRFADELVPPSDIDVPKPSREPSKSEIEMAGRLVESLHERFRPERHEDEYRAAVLALIERKAAGEEIEAPPDERTEEPDDLMAALQASLEGGKKKKGKG
jgi:DNA end-binding protein Ku